MLYFLTELSTGGDVFNLFRYITFRAGGGFFTALLLSFILGKPVINFLKKHQKKGQPIRADGPASHLIQKSGTPTMGGILILATLIISTLLWARWDSGFVWMVLFVTAGFGAIGFIDDYLKVKSFTTKGFSSRARLLIGLTIALIAGYWAAALHPDHLSQQLALPFLKNALLNLGILFFPFVMVVIVGSANAVNLTDGLDGLAIMPVIIAAGALGTIAYVIGRADFTQYLDVHYVAGTGELLIFTSALIGAGLGFLWYNAPPAAVFMGDTGSLGLGRSPRRDSRCHETRAGFGDSRRAVCHRSPVRDYPSRLFQMHGQAGFFNGTHPSSF